MAEVSTKSFEAALEIGNWRLNWVIARVPFDVAKTWGSRGQIRVKGEINGFAFRTSLFPNGGGAHFLLVNKRMQKGAKTGAGGTARFRLEPDAAEREIVIPAELERALSEDRALRRWFDRLNYSIRKYVTEWVAEVKSAEARERRSMQIAERLLATMEAEKELPPVIRTAFARDPRAFEGWKLMSQSCRRGHLLAIFYYRDPKAQARRVAKAVEDAYARIEKSEDRSQKRRSAASSES
jgi:uncharacterized protein YdeI (YjbR/CyaY-like superfamily)